MLENDGTGGLRRTCATTGDTCAAAGPNPGLLTAAKVGAETPAALSSTKQLATVVEVKKEATNESAAELKTDELSLLATAVTPAPAPTGEERRKRCHKAAAVQQSEPAAFFELCQGKLRMQNSLFLSPYRMRSATMLLER